MCRMPSLCESREGPKKANVPDARPVREPVKAQKANVPGWAAKQKVALPPSRPSGAPSLLYFYIAIMAPEGIGTVGGQVKAGWQSVYVCQRSAAHTATQGPKANVPNAVKAQR